MGRRQHIYSDRYPAPRHRGRYREPMHYRRHEGCLERLQRFFLTLGIIALVALILGFAITHLQQTIQFVMAIFGAISFLIAIFPRLLIVIGIILAVFAVLLVGYGLARLVSAISRQLSLASAERAQAATLKAKAKQEREKTKQSSVEVRRGEVRLARETFDHDQRLRDQYRQPQQEAHRTRHLTQQLQDAPQAPQPQSQQHDISLSSVPSISQLLASGAIQFGQADMLHSFELVNGSLEAIRGELPVTAIVAGKGRSGKSRRMMLMIFQAILIVQATGGGKITICDPHYIKPDGLSNVLAPFTPWVRFARTDDEIIAAAKDHIAELESRLTPAGSLHGEGLQLRLIVIDEFSKLMKSEEISKKHKQILTKCVRETAVQWAGVGGRAWIAGQEFTQDAIGDTAIRKDAQAIYCHQLSDEFASFLFPHDRRAQRMVAQIARRECVFKGHDNVVKRSMTPTVLDQEINVMVNYLAHRVPQRRTRQMIPQPSIQPAASRPPTQPIQRAQHVPSQQQGAFHMAQTEDLSPKRPSAVPQRRTVAPPPAASATWQEPDNQDDGQRRQYGHPYSRTLHRTRLTQQDEQTPPPTAQTLRTTENLVPAHIQDATGGPDDTVLIPELPQTSPGARRQFMPRPTTGKMAAVSPPATEDLIQRAARPIQANVQQEDAHPDPVAQLAQLRRRKGGRTTKI